MSISFTVAEVSPRATASAFRTICMSICEVVAFGLVCDPPSSAARRAACRTAKPPVTRSASMTVASKPPISTKNNTGITTAISASDWPRRRRRPQWWFISVTLRFEAHVRDRRRADRSQRREEAGLPGVGVVDGDADEVARAVTNVALCRRPGHRRRHRRAIERIAVEVGGVGSQVAVAILIELVDIDLRDSEQPGRADVVADRLHRLGVRRRGVAEC